MVKLLAVNAKREAPWDGEFYPSKMGIDRRFLMMNFMGM
jgi:hypothetical protein